MRSIIDFEQAKGLLSDFEFSFLETRTRSHIVEGILNLMSLHENTPEPVLDDLSKVFQKLLCSGAMKDA